MRRLFLSIYHLYILIYRRYIVLFQAKNIGHITNENTFMMCPTFLFVIFGEMRISMIPKNQESLKKLYKSGDYLQASSIATATATVAPTMGLLPIPMRPIISTCAGTDEEPANCASPCIRPIESVRP